MAKTDPNRVSYLTSERRCTICGWSIAPDESGWAFARPEELDACEAEDVVVRAKEGVGHLECMCYSALVCPFLTDPDREQKLGQKEARGELVLAGVTGAFPTPDDLGPAIIGPFTRISFTRGEELEDRYRSEIAAKVRTKSSEDTAAVQLLSSDDDARIKTEAFRAGMRLMARQGVSAPGLPADQPCPCEGDDGSYGECCRKLFSAG